MANLGSSTDSFRTLHQPHIQELFFDPVEEKGVKVIHVDQKDDRGVDIVLDICDQNSASKLANLDVRSVICSNLLEHIHNPKDLADLLKEMIPQGGYLAISVPHSYPYHPDPIDTMYRPTPEEIAAMFPEFKVVSKNLVECGTLYDKITQNPYKVLRMLARSLVPFIKFRGWLSTMHHWVWLNRKYRVSCVILQKTACE